MDSYERVHECLIKLGMTRMESIIDSYLEISQDRPVMHILDHLLSEELKHKLSKNTENILNWSGLPFRKTMDDFDFSFQPSIDRKVLDELMTMRFIHNNEDVVFHGSPVVGKTHLSDALGMQAAYSDISIYYIIAVKLVQNLRKDFLSSKLSYRFATYARFPLIIVDEIRYLPLMREESNLFFQFVSSRYEKHSTIYTSNKSFS